MLAREQSNNPRAAMYQLLEQPFIFPHADLTQTFISGEWQDNLRLCAARARFDLPPETDLRLSVGTKDFEVEFISLFEVGMGGAPCPLHSGHYVRDRMVTMEETLRFYRFFNYLPDRSADRFPDHINFELQFMALMAEALDEAEVIGTDILSPLLAQRDFARRNLASWLPELSRLIDERTTLDFIRHAGRMLSNFVAGDAAMLERRAMELEPA